MVMDILIKKARDRERGRKIIENPLEWRETGEENEQNVNKTKKTTGNHRKGSRWVRLREGGALKENMGQ